MREFVKAIKKLLSGISGNFVGELAYAYEFA